MAKKKSFLIYDNWAKLISELPDAQAGELIKAICNYKLEREYEIKDPMVKAIFSMVKDTLDADAEKYEQICIKRAEYGRKGGKQNKANAKQMKANAKQKQTDNDNDNDNDNDIYNNVSKKEKPIRNIIPPEVEWVRTYCEERKNGIDAKRFCDYYEARGWKLKTGKMRDWQAAVRTWEGNQITEKKKDPGYQKTKYDFDALNKMINGD